MVCVFLYLLIWSNCELYPGHYKVCGFCDVPPKTIEFFFFSSRQLTWFTQPVDCLEMSNSPNLSHLLLVLAGLPGACPQTAIVERNDVEISKTLK